MRVAQTAAIFLTAALCALAGCSKKSAVPDPPRIKSAAVIELFEALDNGDHTKALARIARLRELDKGNVYLAKLEVIERNNLFISQAQRHLDAGYPDRALAILGEAMVKHGRLQPLADASAEINAMGQCASLVYSLEAPSSAIQTAKDAVKLKELVKSHKKGADFQPFIESRIKMAFEMEKTEKERTVFDLFADAVILEREDAPEAGVALAQLALEAPDNPKVRLLLRKK
jgi:hypothetical protein